MEGDLDTLVNLAFGKDTKPKNSISIIGSFGETRDLFETLLMIFTKGMNLLYGDQNGSVDLKTLSPNDYSKFTTRFESMGVTPFFYHYHLYQVKNSQNLFVDDSTKQDWEKNREYFNDDPKMSYLVKYSELTSKNLNDYYFQLKCGYDIYVLYFRLTDKI